MRECEPLDKIEENRKERMKELIDKGYLYIAQPPLYKAKQGSSEVYLKDDEALEEYLITAGIKDCVLTLGNGEEIGGVDLTSLVNSARQISLQLKGLTTRVPLDIVEQAAILGALDSDILAKHDQADQAARWCGNRL